MKRLLLWGLPLLYVVHQDFWFWNDHRLLFGFLPAGMAYQVAYTLVVFVWMLLVARFAWPPIDDAETGAAAEETVRP